MIRLDLDPVLAESPRDFTRQIGRHPDLLHWWTLQSEALSADPATGALAYAARKGAAQARVLRAEAPLTDPARLDTRRIAGTDWPCNPDQSKDGCWVAADIDLVPQGVISVVSVTLTTLAGSDPWGLYLDADRPQMVQIVNATTGGQMSVRAFDPDPALREDANIGTAVAFGRVSVTITAIDLDSGNFRIANDLSGRAETGTCARIAAQAGAAQGAPARLAIGRAWREQPIGGAFMDLMLIRGDLFDRPALLDDIRAYWTAVWEGAA